jgi:hypothetical protein
MRFLSLVQAGVCTHTYLVRMRESSYQRFAGAEEMRVERYAGFEGHQSTASRNSRGVTIRVPAQAEGKCFKLPVTR